MTPIKETYSVWTPLTVRWGDMDAYGHVNNAVYATYLESSRIAFFEATNMYGLADNERHRPALASMTIHFRKQVHYPAELEAGVRVARIGTSSFGLDHVLVRAGTDEVVADGSSVIVYVDYSIGKSIPLTPALRAVLEGLKEKTDLATSET